MSSEQAVLYYFSARGRGEIIRLTMAAAGIQWREVHLKEAADFQKLKDENKLLFGQVPLLEIDGKNLVQSFSITRYVANKGNLLGDNNDERIKIDMLFEGTRDFWHAFLFYGFHGYTEVLENAKNNHLKRYLPIFEKILKENGSTGYLIGSKLTLADIGLLEPLLWTEELLKDELKPYEEIKNFLANIKSLPNIKRYLVGPQRYRLNDDEIVAEVKKVLNW